MSIQAQVRRCRQRVARRLENIGADVRISDVVDLQNCSGGCAFPVSHRSDNLRTVMDRINIDTLLSDTQKVLEESCSCGFLPLDAAARHKSLLTLYLTEEALSDEVNGALQNDSFHKMMYFGPFIKELSDLFLIIADSVILRSYTGRVWLGLQAKDPEKELRDRFSAGASLAWMTFTAMTTR